MPIAQVEMEENSHVPVKIWTNDIEKSALRKRIIT